MTVIECEIRPGAYADSIVLMQLQAGLAELPGVSDAGVVMGTAANLELLRANGLLPESAAAAGPDDLVVVVRAESDGSARAALAQVDALLTRRRAGTEEEFRPHSLASAVRLLPEARIVLVSVPGRYAAGVARRALALGRHVFLYSDNVALEDEIALKSEARTAGLLVMGPDCGTAIVHGVGLGFANRVRRGPVGLVGASGTGLQAISSRLHALGSGVSHALGTGGRDLKAEVGGVTALQGIRLLARDPETRAIVLVSKPPAPAVATRLLAAAAACGKPVVVHFLGYPPPARRVGPIHFAAALGEAAELAAELASEPPPALPPPGPPVAGCLRGLFAGGTLAYEVLQGLRPFLAPLVSNVSLEGVAALPEAGRSHGHTVLDLGSDEFTVGRLHPMIDQDMRLRRLRQEAADGETGLILLDVVLGEGAHPDPAAELAPAIEEVRRERPLEFVVLIVGTDEDPQDLAAQRRRFERAGATVVEDPGDAVTAVVGRLAPPAAGEHPAVDPGILAGPVAAINVGLESFYESLVAQGARAVQVDWRPPAGGNERMMALLEKLR